MRVRQAQPSDAADIAAINNAIIRDTLVTFTTDERTAEAIAADIRQRGPSYLVVEDYGTVLGSATYGPFRHGPGYARSCEHAIYLAPDARGKGAGRALMTELEAAACADGIHVLVAGVSSANPAAIAFHKAVGFQQVGLMPEVGFKWNRWLDLVLMQKILATE